MTDTAAPSETPPAAAVGVPPTAAVVVPPTAAVGVLPTAAVGVPPTAASVPETSRTAAVDVATHCFKKPEKEISLPDHIAKWEKSEAYQDLVGFILTLNEAVKDKKISDSYHVSPLSEQILVVLGELEKWVGEIPPIEQPQRFGNKAFRDWYRRLLEKSEELLKAAMPAEYHGATLELAVYLTEGFGNSTRIDYGTGHELAFIAFLCCLCKIGAMGEEDYAALGLKIFDKYLQVVRHLQMTYRMEPAGSHGVWSLDDYQFVPFLWGSAQLLNHKRILPKSFVKPDIYENFSKDYLFLAAIKFINKVKTGPFAEHSNQLWNISGVASWGKVNSGLIKMYKAEVLAKFPIVQHFLFGSLLSIHPTTPPPS